MADPISEARAMLDRLADLETRREDIAARREGDERAARLAARDAERTREREHERAAATDVERARQWEAHIKQQIGGLKNFLSDVIGEVVARLQAEQAEQLAARDRRIAGLESRLDALGASAPKRLDLQAEAKLAEAAAESARLRAEIARLNERLVQTNHALEVERERAERRGDAPLIRREHMN
jgi:hypothetical protein